MPLYLRQKILKQQLEIRDDKLSKTPQMSQMSKKSDEL